MKSAPPIAFDYRPSRTVIAVTIAIALVAAAAPWLSALPAAACSALSALALLLAATALFRFAWPGFVRVSHGAAGWTLLDRAQREHPALLVGHRRLGAMLVLDWRHGRRARFRAVLMSDNLDADTRRRLILLLARGMPHSIPAQHFP